MKAGLSQTLDQHLDLSNLCLAATEHAPLPMAVVDGATHIVRYGNPAFCRLMGKSLEYLVGRPFHELIPANDVCVKLLDRVLKTGKSELHIEEEGNESNPVFWSYVIWPVLAEEPLVGVMIQVTESAKAHGQTIAMNEALVISSVRQHELTEAAERLNEQLLAEIAERKQVEEALRQSEAQYRNLFESIDEGFCVIEMLYDKQGHPTDYRFLETNPSFEKQSGIHNAKGKTIRQDYPNHEPEWFEIYSKVARTGESIRFVKEAKALGKWFDVYAFRVDRNAPKVAILFTDITRRKALEEQLLQSHRQLAGRADQLEHAVAERTRELTATNKQMEAFIYSIAHDLRAPLRAMQGFSTLLVEDEETVLSTAGKDYAGRIIKSAQQMDQLLRDLLAFSRIAQQSVDLAPVDLGGVIEKVVSDLESNIEEKGACVEAPGPWRHVIAHEPTLSQVLTNLICNALKFTAPEVPPRVRLWTEEKGEFIRVWVEDNGIGIAHDHQHQIFKLFTRIHGEQYPGTGVGLAIVEKGIERMGGHVGVESSGGSGARFWFELRKAD